MTAKKQSGATPAPASGEQPGMVMPCPQCGGTGGHRQGCPAWTAPVKAKRKVTAKRVKAKAAPPAAAAEDKA